MLLFLWLLLRDEVLGFDLVVFSYVKKGRWKYIEGSPKGSCTLRSRP